MFKKTLDCNIFIENWVKYHVVSSFVTYGNFMCQHEPSKIENTIVRNSFSAVVYTACNITHTIEKSFLPLLIHERAYMTTEFIPPFVQNGTSYRAVVLYKVKRRHCYCTPCCICKREKFGQFNTSLNYVYKYPVSI